MHFLGATRDEVLFVAFLILLVLIAPKMPKIGERVAGLLSGSGPRGRRTSDPNATPRPGDQG